jgi:predicted phage baseplate assembly protein
MPLETPRLDDRTFEDLVQELRRRIPQYTPEWTDHNLSDPGITLIELFAWLTDVMLYRLNRVPDKHYIKLMELIGMRLREPEAAETRVTFWLSAPQETDIQIPSDTQVATPRTETTPAVIFSTTQNFTVRVAKLSHVMSSEPPKSSGKSRTYRSIDIRRLEAGFDGAPMFSAEPKDGDAIYFGFKTDLSHHILGLQMDVDTAGGAGIDPTRPPYEWQALGSVDPSINWDLCEMDEDGTKGFNVAGLIRLHLPAMVEGEIDGKRAFWVRCRLIEPPKNVPQYRRPPLLKELEVGSWGGTIPATHSTVVKDEVLGRSDGSPGQIFYLENTPVMPRLADERLLVRISNEQEELWTEVSDFAESQPEDRHYVLDSATGEIRFGPVLRQRDGSMKRYGAIPPKTAMLVMKKYRYGGGSIGNLQRGALSVLNTSIPYVSRVLNRRPATGGLDREDLDDAKNRVPGFLRSLERAVTSGDYEYLAMAAAPGEIGRVFALQPPNSTLGEVKVLIIPRIQDASAYIEPDALTVDADVRAAVEAYLDERRLLTTRLDVTQPAYYWVGTRVRLRASDHADPEKVKEAATQRLFEFINPLTGGNDGKGWTFGRDLHDSDIIVALQNVPGIDFIRSVELFPVTMRDGEATYGDAEKVIETVAHGVVVSYRHDVKVDTGTPS